MVNDDENTGTFYLGKRTDKIEHDGIGTYTRIEISQNVDNANQKVKWFPKGHKAHKLLWKACFQIFFPSFYSGSHLTNFSIFTPMKMQIKLAN